MEKSSATNWWNAGKLTFKILVTAGAVYWLLTRISLDELREGIANGNPWILLPALLAYTCSQLVASSRLKSFLKANGIMITERYNLRLYQLGLLYNYFLPGGIGGDAYKIYLLKKRFGYSRKKVLASVFFDRLSGLWALCMFIGMLVIFMPRLAIPNSITLTAMLVGTGSYYYVMRLFFAPFTRHFFRIHVKALLVQGLQAGAALLIMYSLGFEGKFAPYILVFMVSSIVALVPSLLGGLGLRELFSGLIAQYLQIDLNTVVLIVLFFNCISLLVASTGIYYIFRPQGLGADKLPSAAEVESALQVSSSSSDL